MDSIHLVLIKSALSFNLKGIAKILFYDYNFKQLKRSVLL